MSTELDRVRAYYDRFDEWRRLETASGALELSRACALIERHLRAPGRVLDLGGGPGRYTLELARRGHRVVLADLSIRQLEIARGKLAEAGVLDRIDGIDEVHACELGRYRDGQFDAVVAFGPFYHLISAGERTEAVREIRRVVKPGGVILAAFLPRPSGLAGLIERAANHPEQVPPGTFAQAASSGVFRNGASGTGFQEGYFATVDEMRALFTAAGFELVELVSLRSLANHLEASLVRLSGPVRAEAEAALAETARDPAVVATCGHAVVVARRLGGAG